MVSQDQLSWVWMIIGAPRCTGKQIMPLAFILGYIYALSSIYSPPHYVLKLLFLGDYINFIFLETLYHQEIIWIWLHLLSWHLAYFPSGIQHGIYIEYSKWLESRIMPFFRLIGARGITWKCYIIYLKSNWPL